MTQSTGTEVWKAIPGFEKLYEISSTGRVRNVLKGRELSQTDNGHGYLQVSLNRKKYLVSRLVLTTFVRTPIKRELACHGPAGTHDNSVGNLRWDSYVGNNRERTDAITHCPRGHELKEPNLVRANLLKGKRDCRTCANDRSKAVRA